MVIRTNHYKLLTFNEEFCQLGKRHEWEEPSCVMNHQWHPAVKQSYWDIIMSAEIGKFYSPEQQDTEETSFHAFYLWFRNLGIIFRRGREITWRSVGDLGEHSFVWFSLEKRGQSGIWLLSANIVVGLWEKEEKY